MSEFAAEAAPAPQQVPVDTATPNTPTPVERSTPVEPKPEPAPEVKKPDLDTAIKTAFERSKADKEAKEAGKPAASAPEPKETPEAKAARERQPDGKFAPAPGKEPKEPSAPPAEPADGSGQDGKADAKPSEGKDYTKPPAHFLPRAKEAWASASPDVQSEVHRMAANYEKGLAEHKESHEFRKELREFEDLARNAGTTVKGALSNYVAIDNLLKSNPVAGVERILSSIGITPQQYAQHVLGQEQQRQQNPQAAQSNQLTQTVQQLTQKLQEMEQRDLQRQQQEAEAKQLAEIENRFITPFKEDHPRYDELQEDIAFFLNSGKIPSNLSEHERLAAAYDMAERINPAPKFAASSEPGTPAFAPRTLDPSGQKSVTGSPTPGLSTKSAASKEGAKDLDAILRRSLAKATAR